MLGLLTLWKRKMQKVFLFGQFQTRNLRYTTFVVDGDSFCFDVVAKACSETYGQERVHSCKSETYGQERAHSCKSETLWSRVHICAWGMYKKAKLQNKM